MMRAQSVEMEKEALTVREAYDRIDGVLDGEKTVNISKSELYRTLACVIAIVVEWQRADVLDQRIEKLKPLSRKGRPGSVYTMLLDYAFDKDKDSKTKSAWARACSQIELMVGDEENVECAAFMKLVDKGIESARRMRIGAAREARPKKRSTRD